MVFTELQSLIILCFYKYDGGRHINAFCKLFNLYFNSDYSEQSIAYELSVIRSAESTFNMELTDDRKYYRDLWYEYTQGKKKIDTYELYNAFKKSLLFQSGSKDSQLSLIKKQATRVPIKEEPVLYNGQNRLQESQSEIRSQERKAQALINAGYRCELNCQHVLFYRKDGETPYTEAHHLIPLRYQNQFQYSLDVVPNLISLCPSCHRELHYGHSIEKQLFFLWELRYDRLKNCGIEIDYAELLQMYS